MKCELREFAGCDRSRRYRRDRESLPQKVSVIVRGAVAEKVNHPPQQVTEFPTT